jgi:hypothetical protein
LVVVVDEGFVVVVDGATVVVVVDGAVLEDVPAAVVVVVATGAEPPARTCCRARMVEAGGFGSWVPWGANPVVISCRFRNLRSAGLFVVAPPVSSSSPFLDVVVEMTQDRASTMPVLPASGVPAGHLSPLL